MNTYKDEWTKGSVNCAILWPHDSFHDKILLSVCLAVFLPLSLFGLLFAFSFNFFSFGSGEVATIEGGCKETER